MRRVLWVMAVLPTVTCGCSGQPHSVGKGDSASAARLAAYRDWLARTSGASSQADKP